MSESEHAAEKRSCKLCGKAFVFDEGTTIYKDFCSQCAEREFPLASAVRKRIQEIYGIDAAREVFMKEHDGCLPDSMIGDELMWDIINLFKAIGHVVAEAAGLPEDQHTVIVEPSYEDTTWWMITKDPPENVLPTPAQSQIVLFDYTEVWNLGGNESEDDVEKMLRSWKDDVAKSLSELKLVEGAVQLLRGTKFSLLS